MSLDMFSPVSHCPSSDSYLGKLLFIFLVQAFESYNGYLAVPQVDTTTSTMDLTASGDGIVVNTSITDDLSPHIYYAQQDKDFHFLSGLLAFNAQAGSILLPVINGSALAYSTTEWLIDPTQANMMACEKLLASNQEVRDLLEKAHHSGQCAEVRNRGE